jgi:hypothetical protein
MNRREFLATIAVTAAGPTRALRALALRQAQGERVEGPWRTFEITTAIHILKPSGTTRVWVPMPLASAPYQRTLGDTYHADGGRIVVAENERVDMLVAEWDEDVEPRLTATNRVAVREHAADLESPTVPPPLDEAALAPFLRTKKASPRVRASGTDIERARAIYASTIAQATHTDANAAFADAARAASIPAREVWGLRLGARNATRAQQARSEVYLTGYGWVPVDIASRRFGSWDGSWIAYNSARDVVLPGSRRGAIPFLARPQGETAAGRIDGADPDAFNYEITVREIE